MFVTRLVGPLLILSMCLPAFAAVLDPSPDQLAAQGRLEESASAWKREIQAREGSDRVRAYFHQGLVLQQLGLHRDAQTALTEALTRDGLPLENRVQGLTALAYSLSRLGQAEDAEARLREAATMSQTATDRARVALTEGRILWEREDSALALVRFEAAHPLSAGDARLQAAVALFGTQAMPKDKPSVTPKALSWLQGGLDHLAAEPATHEVLYLRIGLLRGMFLWAKTMDQTERMPLLRKIQADLTQSAYDAKTQDNARSRTYALGYLGELSEALDQIETAVAQTREAVFIAQAASLADPLYRWHWQLGHLLERRAGRGGRPRRSDHGLSGSRRDARPHSPGCDREPGRSFAVPSASWPGLSGICESPATPGHDPARWHPGSSAGSEVGAGCHGASQDRGTSGLFQG
ncbi:exported hypothetical protein [Gammaproteobacteria bacterium]